MEIIYSTLKGIPRAWNDVLKRVKGDLVLFTETDVTFYGNQWLQKMVRGARRGSFVKALEVNHYNQNFCSTIIHREDLHGERMDESFKVAEDTDLFLRLKRDHDIQFMHAKNVAVAHMRPTINRKAVERAEDYGYLTAKMIDEHGYYSLEEYIAKQKAAIAAGEKTLIGIKKYQDEKHSLR